MRVNSIGPLSSLYPYRFCAPGRVNLIGDHTDYNEGFVLPLAIDLECVVTAEPSDTVRLRSRELEGEYELPADGSAEPRDSPAWSSYAAGVLRALAERGRPPVGIEATISSSVPVGAGLSSSAALEVALALALCDAAGFALPPLELALACQEAEQVATGVPCGIMDQLTSLAGREDCALLIDCRSLEFEPVPLPRGRLDELLRPRRYPVGLRRTRPMAPQATAAGALEGVEALPDTVAQPARARHPRASGPRVGLLAEGLLAHRRLPAAPARAAQRLLGRPPPARLQRSLPPSPGRDANRRMRTRTSGGVGGAGVSPAPTRLSRP
jgi:Galactokinase galactose-binding signature/GHMP kinases N terminal domain